VALLMEDYDFFVQDREAFCDRLDALTQIRGKQVIDDWKAQVRAGQVEPVVRELLTLHYDPVYIDSMKRNFKGYALAQEIRPKDRSVEAMRALAQTMAQQETNAA
jgi:tRNA 2-selenouridine synthase